MLVKDLLIVLEKAENPKAMALKVLEVKPSPSPANNFSQLGQMIGLSQLSINQLMAAQQRSNPFAAGWPF